MTRRLSPMDEVNMVAKLADLKAEHYKQSLLLGALTELLVEKGLLTIDELQTKTALLDLYGTLEAATQSTLKA